MAGASFSDVASDALTLIGQLGTGQSLSPEKAALCQRYANRMLDKWSIKRLYLYTINTRLATLTAFLGDYTVGPSGTLPTSNAYLLTANTTRPSFIEAAQVSLGGSAQETPLNILTKVQYGAIRDKLAQTSANGLPQDLWPEYALPNLGLHFWPVPANPCTLKLGAWEELQQFVTLFDILNFPPGYEEAIVKNLAIELAPAFDMPVPQSLIGDAADALMSIQAINAQALGGALGESQTLQTANLTLPPPQAPQPGGGQGV